jgi:thiol-disulfide isomerase/thioredoxin
MNKHVRSLLLMLSMLGLVLVVFWAVGLLPTAVSPDANASVNPNPVQPTTAAVSPDANASVNQNPVQPTAAVSSDANASVNRTPVQPTVYPSYIPQFWLEGADGYSKAESLHQSSKAAVLVYVYTDWCPYCKTFDREILRSPEVGEFLKSLVKVKINPEAGPDSAALAERLGISGYPFVFVVPPGSDQPTKIDVFKRAVTLGALQPLEFVQACRQAGAS